MRPTEDWTLCGGVLSPDSEVHLISQMPDGRLFVDGKFGYTHDFVRGDELVVRIHPQDVRAYIDPAVNRRYQAIR